VLAKTGIDLGPEVRLCSNGVLHDDASCRPNGTGGMPWVKHENFDIFPIYGDRRYSAHEVMGLTIQRYLGAPYWRGHLQPACKDRVAQESALWPAVDSINLAAKLDEEIDRRFVVDALASLSKTGIPVDANLEARFRDALHRLVEQKIHVDLVWFVTTYTGGRYAIEQNPNLGRCRQEVQAHAGEGAQFVTGVAGFAVLANHADVSINSAQTVAEAINLTIGGSLPVVDAKLTSAWERAVGNVIHVDASTTAQSQTVYPLWIQFE